MQALPTNASPGTISSSDLHASPQIDAPSQARPVPLIGVNASNLIERNDELAQALPNLDTGYGVPGRQDQQSQSYDPTCLQLGMRLPRSQGGIDIIQPSMEDYIRAADEMTPFLTWDMSQISEAFLPSQQFGWLPQQDSE